MRKKFYLFAWIALVLSFCACEKSSVDPDPEPEAPKMVNVSLQLHGITQNIEPFSKTSTEEVKLRVVMNVFNSTGQVALDEEWYFDEIPSSIPVEFVIQQGTYDLAFWADYVLSDGTSITEVPYSFENLTDITANPDLSSDAFSLVLKAQNFKEDITITEGTTMERAVAKIVFTSTDVVPSIISYVGLTFSNYSDHLNLLNNTIVPISDPKTLKLEVTGGQPIDENQTYWFLFPCSDFTCIFETYTENGTRITSNPIYNVVTERNRKTILQGNFFSNISSGAMSMSINSEWGADRVINIPDWSGNDPVIPTPPQEGVVFADETFENYCLQYYDQDQDGMISQAEAEAVTEMSLIFGNVVNIKSLTGIEAFTKLQKLVIGTQFDLVPITSLDLTQNTELTSLELYINNLKTIDLSQNTQLTSLIIMGPAIMTGIDLSKNTELRTLELTELGLEELDLTYNTKLTTLNCNDNQLTVLDVSTLTRLRFLRCETNLLTELDLSNNLLLGATGSSITCTGNPLSVIYVWDGFGSQYIRRPDAAQLVTKK